MIAVILIVVTIAGLAGALWYASTDALSWHSTPNPCGQVYEGPSRPTYVMCKGFVLTETGASCSLSAGSCTMTLINNETSQYKVVTAECSVMLPIMVNGTGPGRSITVMSVEGINGGPAESGVSSGSQSSATCWFPTNKYMTDSTVDQGVNGCFTFAQAGNVTNTTHLCWDFAKWSMASGSNAALDCNSLVGNLGVTFNSVNMTLGRITVSNANPYGVWLTNINGTSTVSSLGISIQGRYVGDWYSLPQNATVPAHNTVVLNLPGTPKGGQHLIYTLSFLPTNETVTYTQSCSKTFHGTFSVASH